MKIRQMIYVMSIITVIFFVLSGCSLFQSARDKPKTTAYDSPSTSNPSDVGPSIAPEGKSGLMLTPGSAYPAPTADQTSLVTMSPPPYPAPEQAPSQNSPYPAPKEGIKKTPTPVVEDTPIRTQTISNPYPLLGTMFPTDPVGTLTITPSTPTFAGTFVLSGTLIATPAVVRTDIIATNPAEVRLAAGQPQLVEFFGYWCILCKSLAPVINGLEIKYADKMNFIYLNVDDPNIDPLKKALGYTLIGNPHLYLLDGQGNTVHEWIGYVTVEELEAAIKSITNQ